MDNKNKPEGTAKKISFVKRTFGKKPTGKEYKLDWHPTALQKRKIAERELSNALKQDANRIALSRGAKVITNADVREAWYRRFEETVNKKQKRCIFAKVFSSVAFVLFGVIITDCWPRGEWLFIAASLGFAICAKTLEEVWSNRYK